MDMLHIAKQFKTDDEIIEIKPLGIGNINDSFRVKGAKGNYVLQKLNTHVFRDPEGVMENIRLITEHIAAKVDEEGGNKERSTLEFLQTKAEGTLLYRDSAGNVWRMYRFVEGVITIQNVKSAEEAYKAAFAFGKFQAHLADFDAEKLTETIPNFHHTGKRWEAFLEAVRRDRAGRADEVRDLIAYAEKESYLANSLVDAVRAGILPVRVAHNDTKINNILFDKDTGVGICVIDLDTVMPETALCDFGDMVRSGANATDEEDTNLENVYLDMEYYEAFLRGFLEGTAGRLKDEEMERLALSAKVITFELAIRFLGDYLDGDVYFSIRKPKQNLERAANQFKLLADMEEKYAEMEAAYKRLKQE